jgi:hypothetical protein
MEESRSRRGCTLVGCEMGKALTVSQVGLLA